MWFNYFVAINLFVLIHLPPQLPFARGPNLGGPVPPKITEHFTVSKTRHTIFFYGVENSRTGEGQYTESKSAKSSIDRRSNAEPHQKFQHRITPCPNLSPQIMERHWTNQAIGARESIRNPRGDRLSCSNFCFSCDLGPYLQHQPKFAP